MTNHLRIATRRSPLALWQAEHIRAQLQALYPHAQVELLGVTTQGDRVLDQPLADIGGKAASRQLQGVGCRDKSGEWKVGDLKPWKKT